MKDETFNFLKNRREFKLSHKIWQKRFFDPSNKSDVKEYKFFLDNDKWKNNCPFILEWPYLTVTDMIRTQLIDHYIDIMVNKSLERN